MEKGVYVCLAVCVCYDDDDGGGATTELRVTHVLVSYDRDISRDRRVPKSVTKRLLIDRGPNPSRRDSLMS